MRIQKRLAAQLMNCSEKRVKFDNQRLADIKEAITKTDIRQLIAEKAISKINEKGVSRGRARKIKVQKSKDQRKGRGSRQGKHTARLPKKESWMNKIRSQRKFIQELRERKSISNETFRKIYLKCKGGFFRSTRHIKIYLDDNKLFTKTEKPAAKEAAEKKETKPAQTTKKTTKKAVKKTTKKATKTDKK